MIQICTKTPKQIKEENEKLGGRGKKAFCSRYVTYNGQNIDVDDLNGNEIVDIIRLNLEEAMTNNGILTKMPCEITRFVDEIRRLDGFNRITIDVVIGLLSLGEIYGEELMLNFLAGNHLLNEAIAITKFNKESNGDFSNLSLDEIMATLVQMKQNVMNRIQIDHRVPVLV